MARSVGEALRTARERAGLTQASLARSAKIAQAQISQIETGARADPQFSTVVRIAGVLGVSLDQLAADMGLRPGLRPIAQDISQSDLARLADRLANIADLQERLRAATAEATVLLRAIDKRSKRR